MRPYIVLLLGDVIEHGGGQPVAELYVLVRMAVAVKVDQQGAVSCGLSETKM